MSGEVIQTGKTVAVADAAADQRVRQPALRAGGIGPALFAVGLGLQGSAMLARDPDLQRRRRGAGPGRQ